MKTNVRNGLISWIALIGCVLCLFAGRAQAETAGKVCVMSQAKGRIENLEKAGHFVSVGDHVLVILNRQGSALPGDRMEIYETVKTGKTDENGDPIMMHVGRLALIDVGEGRTIGVIESADHEILSGSHVDFSVPEDTKVTGFADYLRSILDAHLKNPATDVLKVAFADVTNNAGEISRMDDEVFRKLSGLICVRKQFSCVGRQEVASLMRDYGLATTANPGKYFIGKIWKKFGADILVTATAAVESGKVAVTLRTYSTKDAAQDPDFKVVAQGIKYLDDASEGGILVKNTNKTQGLLKIVLNKTQKLNGKQVDNFFVESLSERVPEKYSDLINDVVLSVKMDLDDKPIDPRDKGGEYYSDVVVSGTHSLTVSVVPSIPGKPGVVRGKKISKTVTLDVQPGVGTETAVDVKTYSKQVIIAIDSNNIEEQPQAPLVIP